MPETVDLIRQIGPMLVKKDNVESIYDKYIKYV